MENNAAITPFHDSSVASNQFAGSKKEEERLSASVRTLNLTLLVTKANFHASPLRIQPRSDIAIDF